MAGLKILLLWAGIIASADGQGVGAVWSSSPPPSPSSTGSSLPRTVTDATVTASVTFTTPPRTVTNATVTSLTPPRTVTNATVTSLTPPRTVTNATVTSLTPALGSSPSTAAVSATQTTPPNTSLTGSTASQTNRTQNQTSPPVTSAATSTANATSPAATEAPPLFECSYTLTSTDFGFRIDFQNSSDGNYKIILTEAGTARQHDHVQSNTSSTTDVTHLKPCTEYQYEVTFTKPDGTEGLCNSTGNKTETTKPLSKDDIRVDLRCKPGYVCYASKWNLNSSLLAPVNDPVKPDKDPVMPYKDPVMPCKQETTCIRLDYEDICSNLTVTFTSCPGSSFNVTSNITVDFLDPHKIKEEPPTGIPAVIKVELPPQCKNLTVDYTCQELKNSTTSKTLAELEPFTGYSCVGIIKEGNATIGKNTTGVEFKITCDVKIMINKQESSNTSVDLSWDTTSNNCKDLLNLENFNHSCGCSLKDKTDIVGRSKGGQCTVTGLDPYTDYTCHIQATYNNQSVGSKHDETLKTLPGVPEETADVTVTHREHNVLWVTCLPITKFNGPNERYIARLRGGGREIVLEGDKCDFTFKDLPYLTAYKVTVFTFNGRFKSMGTTKTASTSYNDKALIWFLVFLIIITSVALLVVVYKIYLLKRRKSHDMSESLMLITKTNDEENLLPVEPIAAEVLLEAYKRKLADEGRLFLAEFQSIPRIFSRYTVKEAKKHYNVPKNRYVDILPYDYNRVQLTSGNGEAGCDYINASFIDGYKESKKYIAAQGPKDETVSDFWRMVWEQQSSIIVMVTRCEEGNRVKCAQYWPDPDRETEIFEEFVVKLNSEDHCPDFIIRRLSLTNRRERSSEREVTHIQFMSWPDHGVPEEAHLLLKLRRRVNAFKNFFSGPIVVHCSAGVGRTGTYIGIDAMMEGLESEGRVDIYGYVVKLRRQRCLMVQVEAQYILIHQALLEHIQFGETEVRLSELQSALSALRQRNSDKEPTLMDDEFERLPNYKNWRTFNTGVAEENKKKNRSSSVIPYDYNRVLLKLEEALSRDSEPDDDDEEEEEESSDEEDEEATKYINASHLNGYWGPRAFIAAQTPLPDTAADFWAMVYQKRASAVVMLSDEADEDGVYWDNDGKGFGDVAVELVSTDLSTTFTCRNMLLRHVKRKESRPLKHFQFLKWANGGLPEKPQDLTDMIKEVKQISKKSQRGSPVVVHCSDGSARSGIFCALWNLLDSAQTEKLVDVFQVAKTLRKERQGVLLNPEQYYFLYDALEAVFPVQNGDVKAAPAPAADAVQVVNETKAAEQPAEGEAEPPAGTTSDGQQGAAEADGAEEDKKEEPEKVPTETTPLEDTSNGPTVTVEV